MTHMLLLAFCQTSTAAHHCGSKPFLATSRFVWRRRSFVWEFGCAWASTLTRVWQADHASVALPSPTVFVSNWLTCFPAGIWEGVSRGTILFLRTFTAGC